MPELEEQADFMGPWIHKLKSGLNELASENDQTKQHKLAEDVDRLARMAWEVKDVFTNGSWRFG